MKVKDIIKKTHLCDLSQSFTFGSRHLHEDEDMGDLNVLPEQKKSYVSYYENQGHN